MVNGPDQNPGGVDITGAAFSGLRRTGTGTLSPIAPDIRNANPAAATVDPLDDILGQAADIFNAGTNTPASPPFPRQSWGEWGSNIADKARRGGRRAVGVGGVALSGISRVAERATSNRAAGLVRNGVENWARNLDPRGKDRYWFAGAALSTVGSVAISELAFGPAAALLKSAALIAASHTTLAVVDRRFTGQSAEARLNNDLARLEQIEQARTETTRKCRNFFAGVTAGSVYGGFITAGLQVTGADQVARDYLSKLTDSHSPDAAQTLAQNTAQSSVTPDHGGATPQPSPTPEHTATPQPTATATPVAPQSVEAPPELSHDGLRSDVSAKPAAGLPGADSIKATITLPQGSNPTEAVTKFLVDHGVKPTPENVHEAVTKFMEQNNITDAHHVAANVAFKAEDLVPVDTPTGLVNKALEQMHIHAGGVPDSIVKGAEEIIKNSQGGHDQLVSSAHSFLEKSIQANVAAFENLTSQTSSNMTEFVIPSGSNVGKILEQAGHHITWMPDNAELFGSEIAVNFDSLTNYWGLMDKVGYLPDGTHFPATMGELYQIIEKAKGGDTASMDSLKLMLRYVPAGMKLRVLDASGINSAVGVLKALAKAA